MNIITVETLKQQLNLENIDYEEFNDEQLELLLTNVIQELIAQTNLPINPVSHKNIVRDFKSDRFELDYYPVSEIRSIKIGSKNLTEDEYVIDDDLGILYFHSIMSGMVVVEYISQLPAEFIANNIIPLVFDIVKYRLTNNFSINGVATSVKEGDVSVNYDTNTSQGNLIQARINNLKDYYGIRIKVL